MLPLLPCVLLLAWTRLVQCVVYDESAKDIHEALKKGLNAKTLRRIQGGNQTENGYLSCVGRDLFNCRHLSTHHLQIKEKNVWVKEIKYTYNTFPKITKLHFWRGGGADAP